MSEDDKALVAEVRRQGPFLPLRDMSIKAYQLCDRIEQLTAEVERLREALEIAQDYKDCGCSYDNPNDICLGHLKLFERLNARAALEPKP